MFRFCFTMAVFILFFDLHLRNITYKTETKYKNETKFEYNKPLEPFSPIEEKYYLCKDVLLQILTDTKPNRP